ncbi:MAG: DUF4388 domain-containing protein [Chloroflexota bacterium]
MALKGNLQDFTPTQLFNLIKLARKTGGLTIEGNQGTARLYCDDGKLVCASLGDEPPPLDDILLRAGKISAEQARIVDSQKGPRLDKAIALRLMTMRYLAREEIMEALKAHMSEAAYTVFTWSKGSFRFDPDVLPPLGQILISVSLDDILAEGSRRLKEAEKLEEMLPNLDVVLRFTTRPDVKMRSVNLSVDEWKAISFINPRNTIRKIAGYAGMDEGQIRKVVGRLLSEELVELVGREAPKPALAPVVPIVRKPAVGMPASMQRNIVLRLIDRIRRL